MTQFVRKLDNMGRIVLPAEYRKKTGIDDLAEVRITEKDGKIISSITTENQYNINLLSLKLVNGKVDIKNDEQSFDVELNDGNTIKIIKPAPP